MIISSENVTMDMVASKNPIVNEEVLLNAYSFSVRGELHVEYSLGQAISRKTPIANANQILIMRMM